MIGLVKSRLIAGPTIVLVALLATTVGFSTAAQAAPGMTIHGIPPFQSSITLGGFPAVLFDGNCNTTLSPSGPTAAVGILGGCDADIAPLFSIVIDGGLRLDWGGTTANPATLGVSNAEILIINNFDSRSCILNLHDPVELEGPNQAPSYSADAFSITAGVIGDYSITNGVDCAGGANGGLNNAIYQALNPNQGNAGALGTTYTATTTIDATFFVTY